MKLKLYPAKEDWMIRREKLKNWFFTDDGLIKKNFLTQKAQLLLAVILVITIVTIVDWPVLSCQALSYDDGQYLINNSLVQAVNWESCRRFLTEIFAPSTVGGYYQPLTMISLMVDFLFGGKLGDLTVFHRTNLILHLINVVLIELFLYELFHNVWIAALTGLLFGLHPMTVESLAWIAERKTLLATLFSMGALITYLRYCRSEQKLKRYLIIPLIFYILAMMSKPISVPLPLVMLLLDWWPLSRFKKNTIYEKGFFYLFGLLFSIITFISQGNTNSALAPTESPFYSNDGNFNIFELPLAIIWQLFFYITKFFWPYPVTHHYPFPEIFHFGEPSVIVSVIFIFLIIGLCIKFYPRFKALTIGLLVFFAMLLPTTEIITFSGILVSDKYVYLPAIGFLIIMAAFFNLIWEKWHYVIKQLWVGVGLSLFILLILVGEIYSLRGYIPKWKDSITLVRYTIKMWPNDKYAYLNLGAIMFEKKDYPGAIAAYQRVIELSPTINKINLTVYYPLGLAYAANGNYQEALDCYQLCFKFKPQSYLPPYLIGSLFGMQKKFDEAIFWLNQALEKNPDSFHVKIALSKVYREKGDSAKADYFLSKSIEKQSKSR